MSIYHCHAHMKGYCTLQTVLQTNCCLEMMALISRVYICTRSCVWRHQDGSVEAKRLLEERANLTIQAKLVHFYRQVESCMHRAHLKPVAALCHCGWALTIATSVTQAIWMWKRPVECAVGCGGSGETCFCSRTGPLLHWIFSGILLRHVRMYVRMYDPSRIQCT